MSDPISNITRTVGKQFTYDLTWTCGHTTYECGSGTAHLEADRQRAQKGPCYSCHGAARRAAQRGDYRPLVALEPEGTRALVTALRGEGVCCG